jgi:hypothetical protein
MPSRTARRIALLALAIIGAGLIAAPVIFQMFDRAPKGARMIASFAPYMTDGRLDGYRADLRYINAGVSDGHAALLRLGTTAPHEYPGFVLFARQWDGIYPDMSGMLATIRANVGNYNAVAALPKFTLFPWFFVIPGLIVLALLGLGLTRPRWWRGITLALVVLGAGLVLAPLVFGMFSRAPKGANMVAAFKTIETRARVQRIQGYFADIATGQGAVQLDLMPALERSGLSDAQIAARYPGIATFDSQWVHVLNDLTPMIGAMSDNVTNYEAVAALPSFDLFPWFFVVPGLLVIGLAIAARPSGDVRDEKASPGRDVEVPQSQPEGVA